MSNCKQTEHDNRPQKNEMNKQTHALQHSPTSFRNYRIFFQRTILRTVEKRRSVVVNNLQKE